MKKVLPERTADKKIFSLLELTESIQRMFEKHYTQSYWVKAEMNKLNHYGRSGHCHPDLVEKQDGKVIAEMKANLWKADYQRIDKAFKETLGEPLKEGIKMLFQCTVNFHPRYGLSLRIIDIDVNFTLGDLAREKKETINRLTKEGLMDANKRIPMPILPKRIAVISVETSNGYADFVKVLDNNPNGYRFEHTLFPSLLQGDRAIGTMIKQLELIRKKKDSYDLVAIIRGGGGDIGLSFLNNYDLSHAVATFPLPVVTGIGHATNQTVVETIAHKDAITPTEMAEWLLQRFLELDMVLDRASRTLSVIPQEILFGANQVLEQALRLLRSSTRRNMEAAQHALRYKEQGILQYCKWHMQKASLAMEEKNILLQKSIEGRLTNEQKMLELAKVKMPVLMKQLLKIKEEQLSVKAQSVHNLSPLQILKRGYSITRAGGKAIQRAGKLAKGVTLETEFFDGITESTITEIKQKNHE